MPSLLALLFGAIVLAVLVGACLMAGAMTEADFTVRREGSSMLDELAPTALHEGESE